MRNSRTVIFDSNIWISNFDRNDLAHFHTKKLIGGYIKRNFTIYLPAQVILEVIVVLSKFYQKNDILKIIDSILQLKQTTLAEISYAEIKEIISSYLGIVQLNSLDFQIFTYCAKLKPAYFESNDIVLKKAVKHYLYEKN